VVGDRFVLERLAGTGGMGAVFRGHDRLTGEPVAIKVLSDHDAEAIGRFAQETKVLAELGHPHIVRYVAHGETSSGAPWLAMEWLEGKSLTARLAEGPLHEEDAIGLAIRVASALAAAHARGIVHRDVKPSNIFLVGGIPHAAKILDFGLAQGASGSARLTRTGSVLGTPGYMAPEQAQGSRGRVDARADVFSLGALLFECLTGKPAFGGDGAMVILARLLLEDAPRVRTLRPDLPPALDALVAKMLSRIPQARPADAAAVHRALEEIDALQVEARRSTAPPEPPRGISHIERRLVCVVLAAPAAEAASHPSSPTLRTHVPSASWEDARRVARWHGATASEFASGALLLALEGSQGGPARAARCALELASVLPTFRFALVTGCAESTAELSTSDVIERALRLLGRAKRSQVAAPVWIDERTRSLLPTRFTVEDIEGAARLGPERAELDGPRLIHGRPSPFVGRKREVSALVDHFGQAFTAGPPCAAHLVAPAGLGKTRLAREVLAQLREAHPDLAVFVLYPGMAPHIPPALARAPRALLVLEDLQWADASWIERMAQALASPSARNLSLLALARPEAPPDLDALFANRDTEELGLGLLARPPSREILRAGLGAEAEVELLVQRAPGHPFFLEELARGADVSPEALLGIHGDVMFDLEPKARRVLRAAALVGPTFWEGAVLAVLGEYDRGSESAERTREELEELAEEGLISRRRTSRVAGEVEYVFDQVMLREAAIATTTPADIRLGRSMAERWLSLAGVVPGA